MGETQHNFAAANLVKAEYAEERPKLDISTAPHAPSEATHPVGNSRRHSQRGDTAKGIAEADVKVEENLGAEVLVFFPLEAAPVETDEIVSIREGDEEGLLAEEPRAIFTARLPSGTRQLIGKKIRLALDPERCYFFDPDTGESLLARKPAEEPIFAPA